MLNLLLLFACAAPLDLPNASHGLHYDAPATTWDEAFPLGNGTLGALVWGDGQPLKISLDRTDLWDLRPVPEFHTAEYNYETMQAWEKEGRVEDLLRVYEQPYNRPAPTKIPAGRIELVFPEGARFNSGVLDIRSAEATVKLGGSEVNVWVHATEPLGVLLLRGPLPSEIRLVAPAFGGKEEGPAKPSIVAGELTQLGYPPAVETQGDTWRAFAQEGWGGFRFAAFLQWEQQEGTIIAVWSVATSLEGGDPLTLARERVVKGLADLETQGGLAKSHREWWEQYWAQSRVEVPDKLVERQWYLDTYKFGAASRRGAPPITLQGPWTADDGTLPPWKGDYHHDLNTELSYWPCYSGNRLEEGMAYLDWLWNTRENCIAWTKRFFNLPGMNVPMTADLNNEQIGGWRQYTHSATTGAWLAHHFYLHWKFSGDQVFLRERAYPYLREVAVFLEAVTEKRDAEGLRSLPLSSSPEINDNRPTAWFASLTNYDLALIRFTFGAAAEMAGKLQQTEEAARWSKDLGELPAFATAEDGTLLVAKDHPLTESHRHFSHLMAIHPLGLLDLSKGEADARIIEASLKALKASGTSMWCGYSFAWLGSMAARAKDGATAAGALHTFAEAFVLRNSFHANGDQSGKGFSNFTYRPFTLEGNFAAAAGLQEMLLQSHTGIVEVFPAIPEDWQDVAFDSLRAQGGFLVSARRVDGKVVLIEIEATTAGVCQVRSPWNGEVQQLSMQPGEKRVLLP